MEISYILYYIINKPLLKMENLFLTTTAGIVITYLIQFAKKRGASPYGAMIILAILLGGLYSSFEFFVDENTRLKTEEFVIFTLGVSSLIYGTIVKIYKNLKKDEREQ